MNIIVDPKTGLKIGEFQPALDPKKFQNPDVTATGAKRAQVYFKGLKTLWFCTGSLCNIECINCYIDSSPTAAHFVFITPDDMQPYLDEVEALGYGKIEIAFTGGEPYMNPHILRLSEMALERGHGLLVLTNAMRPMMRPRIQAGLLDLQERYGDKMTLRISLDRSRFFSKTHPGHDGSRIDRADFQHLRPSFRSANGRREGDRSRRNDGDGRLSAMSVTEGRNHK